MKKKTKKPVCKYCKASEEGDGSIIVKNFTKKEGAILAEHWRHKYT